MNLNFENIKLKILFSFLILLSMSSCQSLKKSQKISFRNCFEWISKNDFDSFEKNVEFCKQVRDPNGLTTLMMAVGAKKTIFVDLLLKVKADIHAATNDGITALTFAVNRNDILSVTLLRQLGARSEIINDGLPPLMLAARNSSLDVIKAFDPTREEIRVRASDGWTALHFAVLRRDPRLLKFFLERGACVNYNDDKESAIQVAQTEKWVEGLRQLKKYKDLQQNKCSNE